VYRTPHDVPKPVGVSRTHAEILRSLYGRAWYVYGHTLEEMYRVGDSDRERLLLFLGRAAREKGLLNFIEACRLLRPEGFRCAFVGDDSADWEYALLAYSRAREAGVEWLGLQPHDVKASLLRRAYAVVVLPLPPYVEVFGLWALEAFLSGTPVITTRAGAMAEYVVDGWNGRLTSGDPKEVAEAARAGFKAKPAELRTYALENFSSEEMAKRLVEIALAN
jgi:glycosyltransferase involved in cell wall biosynthesis